MKLELEIMIRGNRQIGVPVDALLHIVHVAARQEVGLYAAPVVVRVRIAHFGIAVQLKALALVIDGIVHSPVFGSRQSARRLEVRPIAVAVRLAAGVHIVQVAEQRDAAI